MVKSVEIFKALKIIEMINGDIEMLIERVDKFKEILKTDKLTMDMVVEVVIKSIELIRDYDKK